MALIGKTGLCRNLRHREASGQQPSRGAQAQPDQIGMGRLPEGRLELPAQAEPVDTADLSQLIEAGIPGEMVVQILRPGSS